MPGAPAHAMAGDAAVGQRAQHRLLQAVHVFLDEVAAPAQVDQRIGHDLSGAVVGDLAAAVGGDDRDVARRQHVVGLAGQALREHRRVLAKPELVGRVRVARGREVLHRLVGGQVVDPAKRAQFHRAGPYRTTFTIGWVDSVRYSSSSCSRLVAVTVMVMPR